jgi:hypothetical protein
VTSISTLSGEVCDNSDVTAMILRVLAGAQLVLGACTGYAASTMLLRFAGSEALAQSAAQTLTASDSICWQQPAQSLAQAEAMRVQIAVDTLAPFVVSQHCTGPASPFACGVPLSALPASASKPGSHLAHVIASIVFIHATGPSSVFNITYLVAGPR